VSVSVRSRQASRLASPSPQARTSLRSTRPILLQAIPGKSKILTVVLRGGTGPSSWVPYGNEPWLVAMTSPQPPLPALLLAVSSTKVAPLGVKLRTHAGDALGDEFPGLHVEWSDNRFQESLHSGLPVGIWIAGLALVLGVAALGGYLLLRDVNRDVRMNEVRSQFVASVSHELKTPLTSIRMFAETLAMGRSRDERTRGEYLETIVNESERLARLVDNVLDFSKIEQGKKIYRLRPTRLENVASSAARAMQFPLAQQGFHLHLSVQEEMPELEADPDAIEQAILNLLTNVLTAARDHDVGLPAPHDLRRFSDGMRSSGAGRDRAEIWSSRA
jgi:signal transduction histidine kinase